MNEIDLLRKIQKLCEGDSLTDPTDGDFVRGRASMAKSILSMISDSEVEI